MPEDMTETAEADNMDLDSLLDSMGEAPVVEEDNSPVEAADKPAVEPDGDTVDPDAENEPAGDDPAAEGEAEVDGGVTREALLALPEDELVALLEMVRERAAEKGVNTDEPIPQPDPQVVEQAQQPVAPPQPEYAFQGFPEWTPEALMDEGLFSEAMQQNNAAVVSHVQGQMLQRTIPVLATIMEVQFATMMAERDYPELKGRTADVMKIIAAERQKNPTRDVAEIAKDAMHRIVGTPTQKKAMSALEKLLPKMNGRLATGNTNAPSGARATASAAAPATPRAAKPSIKDDLLSTLDALYPTQ